MLCLNLHNKYSEINNLPEYFIKNLYKKQTKFEPTSMHIMQHLYLTQVHVRCQTTSALYIFTECFMSDHTWGVGKSFSGHIYY